MFYRLAKILQSHNKTVLKTVAVTIATPLMLGLISAAEAHNAESLLYPPYAMNPTFVVIMIGVFIFGVMALGFVKGDRRRRLYAALNILG